MALVRGEMMQLFGINAHELHTKYSLNGYHKVCLNVTLDDLSTFQNQLQCHFGHKSRKFSFAHKHHEYCVFGCSLSVVLKCFCDV